MLPSLLGWYSWSSKRFKMTGDRIYMTKRTLLMSFTLDLYSAIFINCIMELLLIAKTIWMLFISDHMEPLHAFSFGLSFTTFSVCYHKQHTTFAWQYLPFQTLGYSSAWVQFLLLHLLTSSTSSAATLKQRIEPSTLISILIFAQLTLWSSHTLLCWVFTTLKKNLLKQLQIGF